MLVWPGLKDDHGPDDEGQGLFFFMYPYIQLSTVQPRVLLQRERDGEKKYSINKERRRESGGRDGNGKKDEVSPMGEVCADLLNPSNILHLLTYVLHHFSFQGETTRGEIKKRGANMKGEEVTSTVTSGGREVRG